MTTTPRRVRVGTCLHCTARFRFVRDRRPEPGDPLLQSCPHCFCCMDQAQILSELMRPEDAPRS